MPIKLLMPALSPTMTEGTLGKWLKNEGDTIEPGQVIAEIETDKATMEFEAVDSGILAKILVPANSQGIKVNSVIALLAEEGESVEDCIASFQDIPVQAVAVDEKNTPPEQKPLQEIKKNGDRIFASPLAKKIAEQENISLLNVVGTGPYGRIVKSDVLSVKEIKVSQQTPVQLIQQPQQSDSICPSQEIPVSTMRKVIAARLLESKTTIPHFYLTVECNVSKLVSLREEINSNLAAMENPVKISVNDMIVRATGLALSDFPLVNSYWAGDKILQNSIVDISVAVALDDGLITPIVRNASQKSLSTISNEVKSLVKKAKEGKLQPHEFQGGGITISNLGMYNIDSFLAIINPPQSSIISIGGIAKKPVVVNDEIVIGSVMSIGISCDHRVVDGALAAQFLNKIKFYLENPFCLI